MQLCVDPHGILASRAASPRQRALFESYSLNLGRGIDTVSRMIDDDLRSFRDLGAQWHADDVAVVQELFCLMYPDAQGCVARV
jgi:hypothetical protein